MYHVIPSCYTISIFYTPVLILLVAEIVMFEGLTCVYRSSVDLFFYVVGNANENEVGDFGSPQYLGAEKMSINVPRWLQLLLMSVLNCLYDSVSQMLRKNVEKKMLLDKLDSVFLAIDEICDGGYGHPYQCQEQVTPAGKHVTVSYYSQNSARVRRQYSGL